MKLLNKKSKPIKEIKKGKPGIYWDARGGQYYAYDGKSDYAIRMCDETIPIDNKYLKPSTYSRLYRLTPKEAAMHIENLKTGIPSIRFQIRWLEKHLSLTNEKMI